MEDMPSDHKHAYHHTRTVLDSPAGLLRSAVNPASCVTASLSTFSSSASSITNFLLPKASQCIEHFKRRILLQISSP